VDPDIYDQILVAMDPTREIRDAGDVASTLALFLPGHALADQVLALTDAAKALLETATLANQHFSPLGWGVVNIPVPVLEHAIECFEDGRVGEAEAALAASYDEARLTRTAHRAKYLYDASKGDEVLRIRTARWTLLRKAETHHLNGSYEASVLILLAQIEGIIADVHDNRLFFSRSLGRQASLVDPTRLVGIVGALETVRRVYTTGVRETGTTGVLSRHGILHGRELAYDTIVTSAKCWSLLDAVVEWALPVVREQDGT
jgi:hypothetical protein